MLTSQQQAAVPLMASAAVASEVATGLPAAFSMAQCIFESDWLQRCPGNNCFGIKPDAHGAGVQYFVSREYLDGTWRQTPEAFEKYDSLAGCFVDHARLITQGKPYYDAYSQYQQDYDLDALIRGVGHVYATDPDYADKILAEAHSQTVTTALAVARA